jgi:phosphoribosylpyrophosphate synthetase
MQGHFKVQMALKFGFGFGDCTSHNSCMPNLVVHMQKLLAAMGAAKVSAYVTHGVFPKRSWERFDHDNGEGPEHGFAHFWITDSCARTVKEIMGKPPFEVLSLAGSIASALHV